MSTLASVGADVEGIEKLVAAAKKEVAAAENKVAAAKKEVAAAKKEVAAAKKEVAAAETEDDNEVAKKMLKIAVAALETAQKGLDTSEEERESQVSVLHALNDTLNQLRREALQVHQDLGATPTGTGAGRVSGERADAGAAGDERMEVFALQVQQLKLDLAAMSQRAEHESWKNHILKTQGLPLFEEVCTELTDYVKNEPDWLRARESAPARDSSEPGRDSNEPASVSSSSTGSNASKAPFPNDRVECSHWSVKSEQAPDFLKPLLLKVQERLVTMYDAFGAMPMSEVGYLQPVLRAFLWVVVQEMDLNKFLDVVIAGDGVRFKIKWSGSEVTGTPDIFVYAREKNETKWLTGVTPSVKKLNKAVLLGEVKKNKAAVLNASEHQAHWYLFGAAQCLSGKFSEKAKEFGTRRTCFCTDGFWWRFMQCNGVPGQADTSKWRVAASDLLHHADDIVLYLTHVLKSYVVEATTKAKDGNDSKGSGSLSAEKMLDEGSNDSAEFSAESDGSDDHNAHFRKRTLHARGDGLPRGLDTKAFVEMQSRERVLAFLEM